MATSKQWPSSFHKNVCRFFSSPYDYCRSAFKSDLKSGSPADIINISLSSSFMEAFQNGDCIKQQPVLLISRDNDKVRLINLKMPTYVYVCNTFSAYKFKCNKFEQFQRGGKILLFAIEVVSGRLCLNAMLKQTTILYVNENELLP